MWHHRCYITVRKQNSILQFSRVTISDSASSQFDRISVKDTLEDDICLLQANISHVKRHDQGTYILLAQNNGYIERVGLHVDFLPGKAQCARMKYQEQGIGWN